MRQSAAEHFRANANTMSRLVRALAQSHGVERISRRISDYLRLTSARCDAGSRSCAVAGPVLRARG